MRKCNFTQTSLLNLLLVLHMCGYECEPRTGAPHPAHFTHCHCQWHFYLQSTHNSHANLRGREICWRLERPEIGSVVANVAIELLLACLAALKNSCNVLLRVTVCVARRIRRHTHIYIHLTTQLPANYRNRQVASAFSLEIGAQHLLPIPATCS